MIDILVLNYNDARTTVDFVESVKNYVCVRHILVVDNHSTDSSLSVLKKMENDKVLVVDSGKNGGYGAGNNFGIHYLCEKFHSDYILLSNPDVIVEEKVLVGLEEFLENNKDHAVVAPFMLDTSGRKQANTAFRIPSKWEYIISINFLFRKFTDSFYYKNIVSESQKIMNVGSVTGSMFLMRTEDMLKYGMYDENIFLYCEEIVLGLKMQYALKKIALLTDHTFVHNHSVSISKTYKSLVAKRRLFMNSKLYVIRHYYHANVFEYFVAFFLSKLSIVEIYLIGLLRRLK